MPRVRPLIVALIVSVGLHVLVLAGSLRALFSQSVIPTIDCVAIAGTDTSGEPEASPPAVDGDLHELRETAKAEGAESDAVGQRVASRVEAVVEAAKSQTEDQRRDNLDQLAGQLNRLSSKQSVDEMAGKLQGWLGTSKRAERPASGPVAGEFDYATAQLHDVRREKMPEGEMVYIAVLVDAEGRRVESLMEEIEGESAYKTMQLVKANPLAEMVYRRVVMGFMDNLIKAGKAAQDAARNAEARSVGGEAKSPE